MALRKDFLGERIGTWTVVDFVGVNRKRQPIWLCQCDCGKQREITHKALTEKKMIFCLCQRRNLEAKAIVENATKKIKWE